MAVDVSVVSTTISWRKISPSASGRFIADANSPLL